MPLFRNRRRFKGTKKRQTKGFLNKQKAKTISTTEYIEYIFKTISS